MVQRPADYSEHIGDTFGSFFDGGAMALRVALRRSDLLLEAFELSVNLPEVLSV